MLFCTGSEQTCQGQLRPPAHVHASFASSTTVHALSTYSGSRTKARNRSMPVSPQTLSTYNVRSFSGSRFLFSLFTSCQSQQFCTPSCSLTLRSRRHFPAATFTTHPWVIRDSEGILDRYVGDTAVIEILSDSSCTVHIGQAKHVCPRPHPTPVHWGTYHTRRTVKGIAIMVTSYL